MPPRLFCASTNSPQSSSINVPVDFSRNPVSWSWSFLGSNFPCTPKSQNARTVCNGETHERQVAMMHVDLHIATETNTTITLLTMQRSTFYTMYATILFINTSQTRATETQPFFITPSNTPCSHRQIGFVKPFLGCPGKMLPNKRYAHTKFFGNSAMFFTKKADTRESTTTMRLSTSHRIC